MTDTARPARPASPDDVRAAIVAAAPNANNIHMIIDALFDLGLMISLEDRKLDPRDTWADFVALAAGALDGARTALAGRGKNLEMMVTAGDVELTYSASDDELGPFTNELLAELGAPGRLLRVDSRELVGYFTDAEAEHLRARGLEVEEY